MKPDRRPLGAGVGAALLAVLLLVSGPVRAAITVTDDRGQAVTLAAPAQRIVSLLPSLTESVCALGACARLVGVDRYSNEPPAVRGLPRLGGGLDPSLEAIVALKPDLVLAAGSTRGLDRLQALGLRVVALEPRTHADQQRVFAVLAPLLGQPPAAAAQAWQRIDEGVTATAAALPVALRGQRVFVEVGSGPYAASESSFIGETLARLGLRNVVPGSLGPFPRLNPEFVVRADPDLIVIADEDAGSLAARPGWDRLRAVREGRVCTFTPAQSDTLVRPGPRLLDAARLLADCVRRPGRQPVAASTPMSSPPPPAAPPTPRPAAHPAARP